MTHDFTTFANFIVDLESTITEAYATSPTPDEAELSAAKFLAGMFRVGDELKRIDLDARMKKSGLKAIRSAVYLEEAKRGDKKPSDTLIEAVINSNRMVTDAQQALDYAEVDRDRLHNLLNVCKESHIFFRALAKGRFE